MNKDNTCKNCRYAYITRFKNDTLTAAQTGTFGCTNTWHMAGSTLILCRRNPPPNQSQVYDYDWCGEWRASEASEGPNAGS